MEKEKVFGPSNELYDPHISKEEWIQFIKDESIFSETILYTFAAISEAKEPSCYSIKNEFPVNKWAANPEKLISANIRTVGQNIAKKAGKHCFIDNGKESYWSFACQAFKNNENHWEFKIRDELQAAFEETKVLEKYKPMLRAKLWSGGIIWDGVNKKDEFIAGNYWQIGWPKDANKYSARTAWENFSRIKEHDIFTIKGYGGRNDLTIHYVGEVVSKDEALGRIYLNPLNNIPKYKGKAPKLESGTWFGTLFEVNGANVIDAIFGLKKEWETAAMDNETIKLKELLENTHNIILHGAPGTGKTHLAREIAEAMNAEFGFVQFHPSYDYTDFVEGLRPVQGADGQANGFKRVDGIFKEFCRKALDNWRDSQKSEAELVSEANALNKIEEFLNYSIENETEFSIKTGNLFTITGFDEKNIKIAIQSNKNSELSVSMLELKDLIEKDVPLEKVKDIQHFFNKKYGTQQYSYEFTLVQAIRNFKDEPIIKSVGKVIEKPFVFIIDEINRGEISKIFGELFFAIDPGYRGETGRITTQYQNLVEADDVFADGFYIPENVYIIGTMNDIDRSVESMDFAFRRRFTFVEITAEETQDSILSGLEENIFAEAKSRMDALNHAIDEIEGLSSAYHIGGAYFLKLKELDNNFDLLWKYHLEGLLREYLRGMENQKELLVALKQAYDNQKIKEN